MSAKGQRGQAAVELLGVACGLLLALMLAWQCIVAVQAWQAAASAARTAARAGAVEAPAVRAARSVLPSTLAGRAQVTTRTVDGTRSVRVEIDIPRVLPFGPSLGSVDAEAVVVR